MSPDLEQEISFADRVNQIIAEAEKLIEEASDTEAGIHAACSRFNVAGETLELALANPSWAAKIIGEHGARHPVEYVEVDDEHADVGCKLGEETDAVRALLSGGLSVR